MLADLLGLLPLPNIDGLIRITCKRHKQALIVWTKSDTYELFRLDVVTSNKLFAPQIGSREVIDCADWVLRSFLCDCKVLFITSHCESRNTF